MNHRVAGFSALLGLGLVAAGCSTAGEEPEAPVNAARTPPASANKPPQVPVAASSATEAAPTPTTPDNSKAQATPKAPVATNGTSLPALSGRGIRPAVALIDGKEINGDGYFEVLLAAAGRRAFDEVVDLVLVQQACTRMSIAMDAKSNAPRIQSEIDRALEGISGGSKEEKGKTLSAMLTTKGITAVEWRMSIETNAGLGALLGKPATVGTERTAEATALLERLQKEAMVVIANRTLAAQYPEEGNGTSNLPPAKFGMRQPTQAEFDGALGPGDLAIINGRSVNRPPFDTILMQVAGMRVFQQVFDLILARNACAIMGVPPDPTDRVRKEMERALNSLPAVTSLGERVDAAQKQKELAEVLSQRKVAPVEFQMGLETSADLRALAQGKTGVSEDETNRAYEAQYGERRMVHILALPDDEQAATEMAAKYRTLIASGIKTEDAASQLKQTPPANWTISKSATEVPEIRAVTFEKLTKLGDLSDITSVARAGKPPTKVLVLLDRILEDRRDQYPLTEALREDLRGKVQAAKEQAWMNNELQALRKNAVVEIKDPALKTQYDQVVATMKAQAAKGN